MGGGKKESELGGGKRSGGEAEGCGMGKVKRTILADVADETVVIEVA